MRDTLSMSNGRKSESGQNFVRWLSKNALTVADVARATGITQTTLYSFAQGDTRNLTGERERRIAKCYGTTAEVIFGGQPDEALTPAQRRLVDATKDAPADAVDQLADSLSTFLKRAG